jgi:hypothetical protein
MFNAIVNGIDINACAQFIHDQIGDQNSEFWRGYTDGYIRLFSEKRPGDLIGYILDGAINLLLFLTGFGLLEIANIAEKTVEALKDTIEISNATVIETLGSLNELNVIVESETELVSDLIVTARESLDTAYNTLSSASSELNDIVNSAKLFLNLAKDYGLPQNIIDSIRYFSGTQIINGLNIFGKLITTGAVITTTVSSSTLIALSLTLSMKNFKDNQIHLNILTDIYEVCLANNIALEGPINQVVVGTIEGILQLTN